jgi:hypothetical protein
MQKEMEKRENERNDYFEYQGSLQPEKRADLAARWEYHCV